MWSPKGSCSCRQRAAVRGSGVVNTLAAWSNMARLAASSSLRMARWPNEGASKPTACRDAVAFCRAARAGGKGPGPSRESASV